MTNKKTINNAININVSQYKIKNVTHESLDVSY